MDPLDSPGKRRSILASLGGVLLLGSLALDDIAPDYVGLAVLIPVFLGFGVLEIYSQYNNHYGATGRGGVILSSVGLGFLLIAILLYVVAPPGLFLIVIVAVPGVTGLFALTLGSALLSLTFYRLDVLHGATAVLLALGIPLTPLVGALLAAIAGSALPAGVAPGFSAAPYGVAWILIGYRLWQTAGESTGTTASQQESPISVSPHLATTGVIGALFVVVSIGRFLPVGPLSGTPWVNESLLLDIVHLLVGVTGLGVTGVQNSSYARMFNRVVGILLLGLTLLTFVHVFHDAGWLAWLLVRQLDLNMPDAILHLPAGSILVTVGFGVDHQESSVNNT